MADTLDALKKYSFGVAVILIVASVAWFTEPFIPCTGKVMLAILFGMVAGNIMKPGKLTTPGIAFCSKKILPLAIALLGFSLQWNAVRQMGWPVLVIVVSGVAATLGSSCLLGRLLGFKLNFSLLLGTGNAICGSSAIAAAAPVLDSDSEDIALSLGVVNLLGSGGMLLLPMAVVGLGLDDRSAAYLIGGSLQAVGQVAAAGMTLSEDIGVMATSVKMVRILMLIPVMILLSLLMRRIGSGSSKSDGSDDESKSDAVNGGKTGFVPMVPGYLLGFVACSIAAAILGSDAPVLVDLKLLAKILLTIAMAAVGMKIHIVSLLRHAPKAIVLGLCTMAVQLAVLLVLICALRGV